MSAVKNKNNIKLKLQAAMKGPSHPGSTPTGSFRNTVNGGQYAHKIVNIGGICQSHLYVPNFLLPAGGAMPISGYWHVDVFRPGLLPNN